MAKHEILFTLPSRELGKKDIVFEVKIDDKKAGELHVSQGGLEWWPSNAKTKSFTKTWAHLRDFMEDR